MIHKNTIEILGETIEPGTRREIRLPMPTLYDGSPLFSHLHILNGANPGPTLCLLAALHGDELNGIEIIREVLKSKQLKNLNKLNGAIIAAPIVNIYGYLYQQRYLMDRRDLNRSFPGSKQGSLTARIANFFYTEVFKKCDYLIDFHTGSLHRANLPQVRAKLSNEVVRKVAHAFGAPVVLNSSIRKGSLREQTIKNKTTLIVYEAGEALRLDPLAIKVGVQGAFNIINYLGINNEIKVKKNRLPPLVCECSAWIRARVSGLFNTNKRLGHLVKSGEKLGVITNPMTLFEETVITPIPGIIIGINNSPLVHEGGALFNIASPTKLSKKQITIMEMLDNEEVENIIETLN